MDSNMIQEKAKSLYDNLRQMEGEDFKTEHRQVRECLKNKGKYNVSQDLFDLHRLRKKADYKPFKPLTEEDTEDAMRYMENIFDELKRKCQEDS